MIKNKVWMAIVAAMLVLCAALSLILMRPGQTAQAAHIYSDGKLVKTVLLSVDQSFAVEGPQGTNVITVADGKIAVTQADCPDHYCMKRGYCSGGTAIVCLPNKLVIEFSAQQEVDGAVG